MSKNAVDIFQENKPTFLNCVFGWKNFISIAHPKSINLKVGTLELGIGLKIQKNIDL